MEQENIYFHYNTSNKSFLDTHYKLKSIGIKNNAFMLALHNKALLEINPFSRDLSYEQKQMIIEECVMNPWYYLRELLKIGNNEMSTQYGLDLGSSAQLYCLFGNGISNWCTKPRQNLLTCTALAFLSWVYLFDYNKNISINMNRLDNAKRDLFKINEMIGMLPEYMQSTKSIYNKLKHIPLNTDINTIMTHSMHNYTKDKAKEYFDNDFNYIDDAAFINNIGDIIDDIKDSKPINIFTSVRNYYGKDIEIPIIDKCLRWKEEFYDLTKADLLYLVLHSDLCMVYIEYNYKTLGLPDEWVANMKSLMDGDGIGANAFRGEILLEWL